jgi:hypothetical protein
MKLLSIFLSCSISIIVAAGASASPVTTYQEWTFNDADNPAWPEFAANPYGTPTVELSGEPDYTFDWYSEYLGHTGVWHAEFLDLRLEIPNRPISDEYKEIWITVIFQGKLDTDSVTPVPGGDKVTSLGQTITNIGNSWKELVIGWRLEPNPESEIICMGFSGTGSSIDSVVVETICIPEPATLAMLGLGALALLAGRRK